MKSLADAREWIFVLKCKRILKGIEKMKCTNAMFIAVGILCLCFAVAPAAAVWNNGNWVSQDTLDKYRVVHDPATGVDSKYRDVNPAIALSSDPYTVGGKAYGSVRAGYSTLSPEITVTNDLFPDSNQTMVILVQPDGKFEIPAWNEGVLSPGNYTAVLDNFNLPDETVHFQINAGKDTRFAFIGQAASSAPKVEATPTVKPTEKIHIVSAVYGATWITYTTSGKHQIPHTNGQYVDVRSELQQLVNGGDTSFTFDVATIHGLTKGDSVSIGADPDQGIVKNAIVTYTDNHFPFIHIKVVMEQDFNNPYPQSDSVHVPYHAPTSQTTLNL